MIGCKLDKMEKERITIYDSTKSAIVKMVEGNPGAIDACMCLLKEGEKINAYNTFSGYVYILTLDKCGIYGTDIYVLWSDICKKNTLNMIAVLTAVQLGMFDGNVLADACHRQDYSGRDMVPIDDIWLRVKAKLGYPDVTFE